MNNLLGHSGLFALFSSDARSRKHIVAPAEPIPPATISNNIFVLYNWTHNANRSRSLDEFYRWETQHYNDSTTMYVAPPPSLCNVRSVPLRNNTTALEEQSDLKPGTRARNDETEKKKKGKG
jgi:hypothetical protein